MPSVIRGVDNFDSLRSKGLGDEQTWQDMAGSRSAGVTYTNNTGRSIDVLVRLNEVSGNILVDGQIVQGFAEGAAGTNINITFTVPPGSTYEVDTTSVQSWAELR